MNQDEAWEPQELLAKAITLLQTSYNIEEDTFFLVLNKGGKTTNSLDKLNQVVIGEFTPKPTLAFIWQVIQGFSQRTGENPYVYIVHNILAPFIAAEQQLDEQLKNEEGVSLPGSVNNMCVIDTDLSTQN
jgi:hypothetical protein